jgi:hypothetical protein
MNALSDKMASVRIFEPKAINGTPVKPFCSGIPVWVCLHGGHGLRSEPLV